MSPQRIPDTWYTGETPTCALRAAATLYRSLSGARRYLYLHGMLPRVRLPVPVVVVGNLTAGGTGKTPLTLWLAAALAAAGRKPGIVCRSYAAQATSPGRVSPADDPHSKGDEAVLMATRATCPVWSGPKRSKTATALIATHPGVDVVICDDGLQHYALQRDVEIAVIDANRGFGNGRLLPAGPLREPLTRLHRVDAIVLNGTPSVSGLPADVTTYRMTLQGDRFTNVADPDRRRSARDFANQRIAAVAGIGNPERFFDHLRSLQISFSSHVFPDHHCYTADEVRSLDADCVLMTEKDAIKCARFADERMWMLPVDADVDASLLDDVMARIKDRTIDTTLPAVPPESD